MAEWSVDQTREWVVKTLYEKYMEDEQASIRWSAMTSIEATETHPHSEDIVRECKHLADCGWVEILTQAYGYIFAQMAPAGRDAWEAFLGEKESNSSATLSPE